MNTHPLVAVFAGIDGTGGAGIIADTRTITTAGALTIAVTTAVTAQNLNGVQAYWPLSSKQVRMQVEVLRQASVAAIKIGVCGNAVAVIVDSIRHWQAPVVWDPVLFPTCGVTFVNDTQRKQLMRHLLPQITIITPNRHELALLSGRRRVIDGVAALLDAGARQVLVTDSKRGTKVCHALYDGNRQVLWEAVDRRRSGEYHGSGCFFSALLAARLAMGDTSAQAAAIAHGQTLAAIDKALNVQALGSQKLLLPEVSASHH